MDLPKHNLLLFDFNQKVETKHTFEGEVFQKLQETKRLEKLIQKKALLKFSSRKVRSVPFSLFKTLSQLKLTYLERHLQVSLDHKRRAKTL